MTCGDVRGFFEMVVVVMCKMTLKKKKLRCSEYPKVGTFAKVWDGEVVTVA